MPNKPLKPCNKPGCPNLTNNRFCQEHEQAERKRYDDHRPEYHSWYSTKRWRMARKLFLLNNPLCVECTKQGELKSATIVDHIEPHKGDPAKFWNIRNWQSLCKRCHDRKTAKEDGGFGN